MILPLQYFLGELSDQSYKTFWHYLPQLTFFISILVLNTIFLFRFPKFSLLDLWPYYKSFKIVIYDRNDSTTFIFYERNNSGLYYKTMIVTRQEHKL